MDLWLIQAEFISFAHDPMQLVVTLSGLVIDELAA